MIALSLKVVAGPVQPIGNPTPLPDAAEPGAGPPPAGGPQDQNVPPPQHQQQGYGANGGAPGGYGDPNNAHIIGGCTQDSASRQRA